MSEKDEDGRFGAALLAEVKREVADAESARQLRERLDRRYWEKQSARLKAGG